MHFLVTGGTGFIGSHLVDALLARGDSVTCLVRDAKRLRWLEGRGVRLAEGDVAEGKGLDAALEGAEAVVHAAGVIKADSEDGYVHGNAGGTRNLLEACLRAKREFRSVMVVTSLAAVGPPADGVAAREGDACRPVSAYGRSKAKAEEACLEFRGKLPVVVARPPIVYGPRDEATLEIFRIVKRRLKPNVAPDQRLSLIHARDLALGLIAAGERGKPGERYFLAHEEVLTARELADRVEQALGVQAMSLAVAPALFRAAAAVSGTLSRGRSIFNRDKAAEMTARAWVCDVSGVEKRLAWRARIAHTDGLAEAARWYREAGWV
ncbi:MAG: NAD-dependent epimerase/dehydratase family protein [Planctomycetes bacterium]|nr:NAD-dependent epimerase/dehydratase family protein [Planctomycetota bacterium]